MQAVAYELCKAGQSSPWVDSENFVRFPPLCDPDQLSLSVQQRSVRLTDGRTDCEEFVPRYEMVAYSHGSD